MPKHTSAEAIRRQVANDILSGALLPGTALDETQLAADFLVSRTPVREALRLLAASGLVDQKPHAKALVARPSDHDLAGMFEVMGFLEAQCAAHAAAEMSGPERGALDRLHGQMSGIVHAGDTLAYSEANEAFHSAIYDGAHNAYLAEITRSTRQRLQPFRQAQFAAVGRLAKSHAEHDLIVESILRGDRTEAENAMRSHILSVEHAYEKLKRVQA